MADEITPDIVRELKEVAMFAHSYEEASCLMGYTKEKHDADYNAFSEFKLPDFEKERIESLYTQAKKLMGSFEVAIEKYRDNDDVLGIVCDVIANFEQMAALYSPLDTLEYLEDETVMVSTKFRPFFIE